MKIGKNVLFGESEILCLGILHFKKFLSAINLSLSVKMDRYTRYYVIQSGGGDIGPEYRASFRMQRGNSIVSSFRGVFPFVKPLLYSGAKAVEKEAIKTRCTIITDSFKKEPEQPVGNIFKTRFTEAKDKLAEKIKKMTGSGLGLKRKRKPKNAQFQG